MSKRLSFSVLIHPRHLSPSACPLPHVLKADQQRSQRDKRRGESHPEEQRRVYQAEQPRQRYVEEEGRYQAMYHREERIVLPAEIGIDAEHKADHDAVDTIAVQIGRAYRPNPTETRDCPTDRHPDVQTRDRAENRECNMEETFWEIVL